MGSTVTGVMIAGFSYGFVVLTAAISLSASENSGNPIVMTYFIYFCCRNDNSFSDFSTIVLLLLLLL